MGNIFILVNEEKCNFVSKTDYLVVKLLNINFCIYFLLQQHIVLGIVKLLKSMNF